MAAGARRVSVPMNRRGLMVLVCVMVAAAGQARSLEAAWQPGTEPAPAPSPAPQPESSPPPAHPVAPPATNPPATPPETPPSTTPGSQPPAQPASPATEPKPAEAKPAEPQPAEAVTPQAPPHPDAGSPAPKVVQPVAGGDTIEAVVYLKDGRRLAGFLHSRDEKQTILRIEGVNSPIAEELIDRVEILPSVEERYEILRAAINDKDVDRLVLLCQWLLARKQYDIALRELEPIVKAHPENLEARRLKTLVEQQKLVDQASAEARARRGEVPEGTPGGKSSKPLFPTLLPDDINLMRVFQVDLDNPPKIVIPREMIDEMIRKYADRPQIPSTQEGREAMYRKRAGQILRIAFELKARELYGMARVLEDPKPIKAFREDVWRGWVLNSCATSRCHGGEEAGRLWLLSAKTNAEATVFTNLMILHQFKLADGTPLINYDKPAESPLLQMALRPEASKLPHPRVDQVGKGEKFRPVFASPEERRFQETVEWIKSMYVPQGREYPIKYDPPVPAGARPIGPDSKKADPGR